MFEYVWICLASPLPLPLANSLALCPFGRPPLVNFYDPRSSNGFRAVIRHVGRVPWVLRVSWIVREARVSRYWQRVFGSVLRSISALDHLTNTWRRRHDFSSPAPQRQPLSFTLPHPLGSTISFPFCRRSNDGFVSSLSQRVLIWLIDGKRERDGIGSRWMGRWQGWQGTERNIS